jgi:hypothetical protein
MGIIPEKSEQDYFLAFSSRYWFSSFSHLNLRFSTAINMEISNTAITSTIGLN